MNFLLSEFETYLPLKALLGTEKTQTFGIMF